MSGVNNNCIVKRRFSRKLQHIASQPGLHNSLNFETGGDGSSE